MSGENFVKYFNFNRKYLSGQKPVHKNWSKEENGKTSQGDYHNLPLSYNYGTDEAKMLDGFYLELCNVKIRGIADPTPKYRDYSCMAVFDISKERVKRCVDVIFKDVYGQIIIIIDQYGDFMKDIPKTIKENPGASVKQLIYWPKNGRDIIDGKNPSQFFKLVNSFNIKTLFTGVDGKNIPWGMLKDATFEGLPLIHYSHVYSSGTGKLSPQFKMVSMVVTSVVMSGTISRQLSTVDDIKQQNPELVKKLAQDIMTISKLMNKHNFKGEEKDEEKDEGKVEKKEKDEDKGAKNPIMTNISQPDFNNFMQQGNSPSQSTFNAQQSSTQSQQSTFNAQQPTNQSQQSTNLNQQPLTQSQQSTFNAQQPTNLNQQQQSIFNVQQPTNLNQQQSTIQPQQQPPTQQQPKLNVQPPTSNNSQLQLS